MQSQKCYDYRTARVRIEHEIRLVLRGDLTVSDASERIMILAKLWNGELDDGTPARSESIDKQPGSE